MRPLLTKYSYHCYASDKALENETFTKLMLAFGMGSQVISLWK